MRYARTLISVGYPLALFLIAMSLIEALSLAWPVQLGDSTWRYGFVGLFFSNLIPCILGIAVITCTAAGLGHARLLRAFAVVDGLCALVLIGLLLSFLLDFIQLRGSVRSALRAAYDHSAQTATTMGVAGIVVCGVLAACAWRASSSPTGSPSRARQGDPSAGLVTGRQRATR